MDGLVSFLIFGALFYFMMRFGCGAHMVHGRGEHDRQQTDESSDVNHVDPVCGMKVAMDQGYGKMHQGRLYRFCSRKCLDAFEATPKAFVGSGDDGAGQRA